MNSQQSSKTFSQKITDVGFLLKNTFNLLWLGGQELKKPTIKAAIYALITTFIFFLAIFTVVCGGSGLIPMGILFIFIWGVMKFYGVFYFTRLKADQSLMAYKSLTGSPISYEIAHQENNSESWKIRGVAFVNILIAFASSNNSRNRGGGIINILFSLFFFALVEVWDLVSNYLLPSVVIEKRPIKEILPHLKPLKDNIPSALTGVFGIDFAGAVLGSLLGIVYFFGIVISAIFGYVLAFSVQSGTVLFDNGVSINFYPLLVVVFIIALFGAVYGRIIDSIKTVYYSCFYTSLAHPDQIKSEYKENVEKYLNFKN